MQSLSAVRALRKSFRSGSVVPASYKSCSRDGALLFNRSSNVIRCIIY